VLLVIAQDVIHLDEISTPSLLNLAFVFNELAKYFKKGVPKREMSMKWTL